ncbi:Pimeloyl-ACP methyl ester carboxylesterase [Marinobacter segnicrescens]|uniref:Pimeloyl-ACP methyl ester carboxylesterase n=1 Tax=Marinobacter segnicrescens TaxID=430453 RepID=A0A1I0FS22_9GAMM|nr:alpha/beta fold hydrolase [Marinobacter segnicrescens]SET61296.1 Pimeloyl-ACP methyl ester carboxylesterase [Marinobacter segnicrescens]
MKRSRLAWLAALLGAVLLTGCSRYDLYEWLIAEEREEAGLQLAEATLGELSVTYLSRRGPSDARALVMVHGFAANKDNWVRMAAHLPDDYHLVIPDLPGHGDSSVAGPDAYTVEAQAATLIRLLDRLGIEQVDMAGNSMGGGITAYVASRYPDRVRTIALFDPAGSTRYPSELDEALAEGHNPLVVREPGDFDKLMDFVMEQRPFAPWPITSVMEEQAMARQSVNDQIFDAILSSGEQLDLSGILPAIEAPTLIVWGKRDRVLAPENAEVFAAGIEDSTVVLLEGVGHVPMLEVPEKSAQLWHRFLQRHPEP